MVNNKHIGWMLKGLIASGTLGGCCFGQNKVQAKQPEEVKLTLVAYVVALALALDTKKTGEAGLIEPGWKEELPNKAIAYKSVAAIVKPEDSVKVDKWSDLANESIEVIIANHKPLVVRDGII